MRQVLIVLVMVLFPQFAFGDVFEGRFPDKTGNIVEVKAIGKRIYELKKTVIENGKERVIRGRGVVVNGKLFGKFRRNKKGKSFRSRLGEIGGGESEVDIDVTLGELIITLRDAERRKAEAELKERARERGFEEAKPIDFNKVRSVFARPDLRVVKIEKAVPARKQRALVKAQSTSKKREQDRKEKGGLPPAVPAALALLALAAARRRRLRLVPKGKTVGGKVFRGVLPKISGALIFSARDRALRKALSLDGRGVAGRLATRLKFLPRPEGLIVYADALRDLGRRSTIQRFQKFSIQTAAKLEELANAIDKTLKVAVKVGRKDVEFLEQERALNKIVDELEGLRDGPLFLSDELLKVRGDDPRNRIIDVWFDPTEQFTKGGFINKAFGFAKLGTYAVLDSVLGTLSRTDANIAEYNEGLFGDEEYKSRQWKGAANDLGKLGIVVLTSAIQPTYKLGKVGQVGFAFAKNMIGAAGRLTVDAVTEKGRGVEVTNSDLAKEGAVAVLSALLAPAGNVNVSKAVPQSAGRQLFRQAANAKVQGAIVKKLVNGVADAVWPEEKKRKLVKSP